MSENCMANCMASKIHLQLRNKIFYYRVELPRIVISSILFQNIEQTL